MTVYTTPSITELGNFAELTLLHKAIGHGDVVYIGNTPVGEGGPITSLS